MQQAFDDGLHCFILAPQGIFAVPPTSPDTAQSVVNGDLQLDLDAAFPQLQARRRRSVMHDMEDVPSIGGYFGRK